VPRLPADERDRHVVYFISCLNRGMDSIPGEAWKTGTAESVVNILAAAGIQAHYPPGLEGLCCGTPYSSKGFDDAYRQMAEKATTALWEASRGGRFPILVDTSPCTFKMKHYGDVLQGEDLKRWEQMQICDIIEYLHDEVLPRIELKPVAGTAVLHPTCSCRKMGLEEKMLAVARQCAAHAEIPMNAGCCGFAGDRGFLIPELTESATQREAAEVRRMDAAAGHYSTSRTCEMGMSAATDQTYSALIQLVGQALANKHRGT
jgi:D-lactate dehydrogenase